MIGPTHTFKCRPVRNADGSIFDFNTSPAWQKALAALDALAKRVQPARPLRGHWTDAVIPLVPKEKHHEKQD